MKLRLILGMACAAVAFVPATSAHAANGNSFGGTCKFGGNTTFDHGITAASNQNTFDFELTGTCTGTANGGRVTSAGSSLSYKGSGVFGCLGSRGDMPGKGTLTVDGKAIPVNVTTKLSGLRFTTRFSGEKGGQAGGSGQALNDRFNAPSMSGCAGVGKLNKVAIALPDFSTRGDTLRANDTASSTSAKKHKKKKHHKKKHAKKHHKAGYHR